MQPDAAPGPSKVPEGGKSQAFSYQLALTTFKVTVATKAYPEIKFTVEQVDLVKVAMLDAILSSEATEVTSVTESTKKEARLPYHASIKRWWSGQNAKLQP